MAKWHCPLDKSNNYSEKAAMIICADDYGMRADIDRAILELCGDGRLSAVSCMVLFERCDGAALEKLRAHEAHTDLGLHFCLTDENLPLSVPLDKTRLPLTDIAASLGYSESSAFTRAFRRWSGVAPSHRRQTELRGSLSA